MENTFGNRLKALREEHELTMDYVVLDMQRKYNIEINKGQLSRWERGQSPSLQCVTQHLTPSPAWMPSLMSHLVPEIPEEAKSG